MTLLDNTTEILPKGVCFYRLARDPPEAVKLLRVKIVSLMLVWRSAGKSCEQRHWTAPLKVSHKYHCRNVSKTALRQVAK